jgi:uncharacterized protein YndB with AHSA1/START domain
LDGTQPIRATVTVRSDPARAFELFTARMGRWWPLESYSRAVNEFEQEDIGVSELVFEARMGGLILERMTDGRVLPWAEVVAWQPPQRVMLSWRPHSKPEPPTELEVTFAAREDGTSIEVEHRGWELLSEEFRAGLYGIYERGWPFTLQCFVAETDRDIASPDRST